MPKTIITIGNNAFSECLALTQITLPDGLKSIGNYAFKNTGLTSVIVPDSVTNIGAGAFMGCKLIEITVPFVGESKDAATYQAVFGYIFGFYSRSSNESNPPAETTFQYRSGPNGYDYVYHYYIPLTLKTVTITLADGLRPSSFINCSMLTEVKIDPSATELPYELFKNCSNLTAVNGLQNVDSLGEAVFYNCSKLNNIVLAPLKAVKNDALFNCVLLTGITFDRTITQIGNNAFSGCLALKQITLPDGLKSIGSYAFKNTGLTSVMVPDSVTNIGLGAFMSCKLTEITIPFVGESKDATDHKAVFGYIFG